MVAILPSMVLVLSAITTAVQGYSVSVQNACPVGYSPHQVHVTPHAVLFPVLFNAWIPTNTAITINGGYVFHITDAPRSISTVLTGTSTFFVTSTVTTTVTQQSGAAPAATSSVLATSASSSRFLTVTSAPAAPPPSTTTVAAVASSTTLTPGIACVFNEDCASGSCVNKLCA